MGKAGQWVLYEFENSKGTGTGHNTKIYVMAAQVELFESYLLIAQEVLITGINWRKQSDSYFSTFSCYGPPNQCCYQASKTIVEQFGVTTDRTHSIDITVLANPSTDYNTLSATGNFETGLEYLKTTIKANKQGGQPVVIGVHYTKNTAPFNANKATYHFVVVVGKGYDREKRKHYFRFYDVGKPNGTNPSFKLYVDEEKKEIVGYSEDRLYTVTEVRQNY